MVGRFDPDALIAAKAADRARDSDEIAGGRMSAEQVNARNGLAQKLDMRRSWVRVHAEME